MKILAKWSVDEYHHMIEADILRNRRVELLRGEIVEMSPETPIHYTTAKRGTRYLEELLSGIADVRFNGPITLADSEPEPDIAIVRLPESLYDNRHPGPEDILWIIEIAKSSLKKDLEVKLEIYAAAGIPEYWILDLSSKRVIILRSPRGSKYLEQLEITDDMITPLAFTSVKVSVKKLLP
jgi:Uma2 family endonuclease